MWSAKMNKVYGHNSPIAHRIYVEALTALIVYAYDKVAERVGTVAAAGLFHTDGICAAHKMRFWFLLFYKFFEKSDDVRC